MMWTGSIRLPGKALIWKIITASGLDAIPFATTARLKLLNRCRAV
jgi:hypothetical protein